MLRRTVSLATALAAAVAGRAAVIHADSPAGVSLSCDAASGRYTVAMPALGWSLSGTLPAPAGSAEASSGADALGAYREIAFTLADGSQSGFLRAYAPCPTVLFSVTARRGGSSRQIRFPDFTSLPAGLQVQSFKESVFSPFAFDAENTGTPWLLFDGAGHAAVISPAAHFMIATMLGDATTEMASALNPGVADLPNGFTQQTLLAFAPGIHAAWQGWGTALTRLEGRVRPANDADPGLAYLGYWTDSQSSYYFRYDETLGYEGTLDALVRHYRDRQIPIRYLQLDSWWYYKSLTSPTGSQGTARNPKMPAGEWNRYGGMMRYEAHPAVFPDGLSGFAKKVGLPLITHNRWVDVDSPYRATYAFSGVAGIDPRWWAHLLDYVHAAGTVCYEQDWLNEIYEHSPELGRSLTAGDAFTDSMAKAAQDRGMSLQYCMVFPRWILQGSRYSNLTTTRVSSDRFDRKEWDDFLFNSPFASALGIWPWTDFCFSTELDNLTLATLSAGMVGVGDALGAENKANLLLAARADGVLVKPDASIVPSDATYQTAADSGPMVAWTHTDHEARRSVDVFAYGRKPGPAGTAVFTPAKFGLAGKVFVYDPRTGLGALQDAAEPISVPAAYDAGSFRILVPEGRSGIALVGDSGKIVPDGRKRIARLTDDGRSEVADVIFAAKERSVTLVGYAARRPALVAQGGGWSCLVHDPISGRFTVDLTVDAAAPVSTDRDPVRRVRVTLQAAP